MKYKSIFTVKQCVYLVCLSRDRVVEISCDRG